MATYACYADLTDAKSRMSISDTAEDAAILRALETASRWLEGRCQRHFSVRSETRYFTSARSDRLLIDDLLSLTTLQTDEDSDLDYDYTWAATDWLRDPPNGYPTTRLLVHPSGNRSFPTNLTQAVKIVGLWGWGNAGALGNDGSATPYEDSGTDTSEELDASETVVDVGDQSLLAVGNTILVESEQMYIRSLTNGTPDTATVFRGVNGTTAATHATAKDIYIYRYPDDIREACILRAIQLLRGTDVPFNIEGNLGEQRVFQPAQLWARILDLIGPFRKLEAA